MDLREKLIELLDKVQETGVNEIPAGFGCTREYITNEKVASHLIEKGVTVQEWIPVSRKTPTEADGTVLVCLADKFPYNEKEHYVNAKHDGRVTEAHYSEFSKRWYKDDAIFLDGDITHWMKKPEPPKGD